MNDDRNYYRQLTDAELIDLAEESPTAELARVLAERLTDAKRRYWRGE